MTKRIGSGILAVVLALCVCLSAAAEGAQGGTGHAVSDGQYELTFRSEATLTDITHTFAYSESFFEHTSTRYDHALATVTLGLVLAASNTSESDNYYWKAEDVGREANLAAAYETLGFGDARFYNYDASLNTYEDHAAYGIARKTLTQDGETQTLIVMMLRGGGYGAEWASNVKLGTGAVHEGFAGAAEEAFASLEEYIEAARASGELGEVKLWVGGYSRGGAVANLVAAKIAHEMPEIEQENVFVYTFAAPAVMTDDADDAWKLDYDNNHDGDTLKKTWDTSNVFNLLGSGDVVPQVPPENWGYHRNGNDRYLPMPRSSDEIQALNTLVKQINPDVPVDFGQLGTPQEVAALIQSMEKIFTDKTTYCTEYQQAVVDMMQCAFQLSEDEVVLGEVLGNEAIYQRLRSLDGMEKFSWEKLVSSVWLASSMSRPLLERFGQNVPLRVQQLVIPLLATGLCYELETDVIQFLAQYMIGIVSVGSAPAQGINVFKCHYPEVYLALMEYYSPSVHTMQAATRR